MTNRFTIATLAATAVLMALTPPADAAAKQANPAHPTETTAPRDAGDPIMAIVSIKSQQVTIYDADGWILRAPVSTGIKGRETPAGVFSVVEKDKDHHSNLYDDAWMPNMERITWSGIALHGGPLPGYAASHGCIRMPYDFAEKLVRQDADRHARDHRAERCGAGRVFRSETVRAERGCAYGRAGARRNAGARGGRRRQGGRRGQDRRSRSGARGGGGACGRAQAGNAQGPRRRRARLRRESARRRHTKTDQDKARAEEFKQKAAAKAADLGTQLEAAKADAKAKLDAAAAAKDAAQGGRGQANRNGRRGARRKTRARAGLGLHQPQDQEALCAARLPGSTIEVPIAIRDPDKPIGTHIFTAMARTDSGLRWTAVTIDDGDDAKDALDRIAIPQDVLDRIAPTAAPRSSLIISDEPPNREQNYRTEFVVVLNNQPQGGLAIRKPATDIVARDGYGYYGYGYARQYGGPYGGTSYYYPRW